MPVIRHIDALLGTAWAWDDDEDEDLDPPGLERTPEPGAEDRRLVTTG
ncbi:MAG: hypothetical protein KDK70_17935 [Myxococcales bacterium]|nr:hypothetical protein [Myxococcales bacterium]